MLLLLSPAKSLDFESPLPAALAALSPTQPAHVRSAAELIGGLRKLKRTDVAGLMNLSDTLADLNVQRYATWSARHTARNARPAALAFNGDVYEGLAAPSLSAAQLRWAQDHVRILSGLYGLLQPLDAIQPYRLEMGTRYANARGRDLYVYWGETITEQLNAELASRRGKARAIVNCASEEYFKAVRASLLNAPVVHTVFEDWSAGRYKVVSFFAKRARGLMARYAILHRITDPAKLAGFDSEGYEFDAARSDACTLRFKRKQGPTKNTGVEKIVAKKAVVKKAVAKNAAVTTAGRA